MEELFQHQDPAEGENPKPEAESGPAEEEIQPPEAESGPAEEKTELTEEETGPEKEELKPAEEETGPEEEGPKPVEEETSQEEEEPKPEEKPSPEEGESKPGEESEPEGEDPKSAKEEPKPNGEEPSPAEEESKPAEGEAQKPAEESGSAEGEGQPEEPAETKKKPGIVRRILNFLGNSLLLLISVLFSFAGVLVYVSARWMLNTWANLDMAELVYHLKSPLQGTSTDLIEDYIHSCGLVSVGAVFVVLLLFFLLRRKLWRKLLLALLCILGGAASVYASAKNVWDTLDVEHYLENQDEYSTFMEDNYVNPVNVSLTFPEKKRNLIYIFLESMESTYADEESGGAFEENYIPELTRLAEENVNFSDKDGLGGAYPTTYATWTMAGIFAQTAGLPLRINTGDNEMYQQANFFPELTTLGDILKDQGYRLVFELGSDVAFGGRENYFTQHGEFEFQDYYWAKERGYFPKDHFVWWGYEDEKLFAIAREQLYRLAQEDQPFCYTMLTVDPHFEDGYRCHLCGDEFGENQYANVMACSSRQLEKFIRWIQTQDFYEKTTIVLSGDHLTMDSNFCEDIDEDYQRSTYNVFINAPVEPVKEKNRVFTTMDLFPTTLASLGVSIEGERLGLGTNLFSGEETLTESMGFDELNEELEKNSRFFEELNDDVVQLWNWDDEDKVWRYYIAKEERYAKSEWIYEMSVGTRRSNYKRYYFDENGGMVQNWYEIDGKWYHFRRWDGYLDKGPVNIAVN